MTAPNARLRRSPPALAALLLLAGACRPIEGIGNDTPLVDAELRKLSIGGVTVLGGGFGGSGELEIHAGGHEFVVPVRVRGSNVGLGVELAITSHGVLDASVPDGAVVDDLFGRYHGSSAHVGILLGFESHHLKNDAGIEFHGPATTGALALLMGAEWLSLDPLDAVIPENLTDSGEDTGLDGGAP